MDTTKQWVDQIDGLLNNLITVLHLADGLIGSGSDVVTNFISNYARDSATVLKDLLSFGGGAIVITPFNRVNKRELDIVPQPYPLSIPAMTPREALDEFYASFYNTNDPNRPIWTDNTKVVGQGFIVATADPGVLCKLAKALSVLFVFEDFDKMIADYVSFLGGWASSLESEGKNYLTTFSDESGVKFDITGFPDVEVSRYPTVYVPPMVLPGHPSSVVSDIDPFVHDTTFQGVLHWYGLSLDNFTWLKNTVEILSVLSDKLVTLVRGSQSPLSAMIRSLIRKITEIKTLINYVYSVLSGILVNLANAGLYAFTIPEGVGGVNYIQSALNSSLSNPQNGPAQQLAQQMDSSQFSLMFFMGTSDGYNTDAWKAMFDSSWNATQEDIDRLRGIVSPQFSVLPITEGVIFKFGDVVDISVVSQDSTYDNPLHYEYQLYDNNKSIISKWKSPNANADTWAIVNVARFSVVLPLPTGADPSFPLTTSYTMDVQVYNGLGSSVGAVTRTFVVSNLLETPSAPVDPPVSDTPYRVTFLTGISTIVDNNHPVIVLITATPDTKTYSSGITATIRDKNGSGLANESVYIASNSSGTIGYTITAESIEQVLQITDSVGGVINLPVINNKGKGIVIVTDPHHPGLPPLAPSYKFLIYPAVIFVALGPGYTSIKVCNGTVCQYYNIPGFIEVINDTNYTYWILHNGVWEGPFTFATVSKARDGTVICG